MHKTPSQRRPSTTEVADVDHVDVAGRETLFFDSSDARCEAWLYRPDATGSSVPVIVMAHGLGGTKDLRLDAYAERFRTAGYACLVFDYRHFGGSEGEPRRLIDIGRQLEDWRAAIAFARSLPELDPDRVVAWGTSFGGGHVLTTAARDHALAAAIIQCPFTDGRAAGGAVNRRTTAKVAVRALRDAVAAKRDKDPVRIRLSGTPGSAALMTAPDVVEASRRLRRVAGLDPDAVEPVPARIALAIPRYVPGRDAVDIACPLFAALCEHDSVAPVAAAQRYVSQAPEAHIRLYPVGHFDIYVGDAFETTIRDQIAFLHAHVPTGARARQITEPVAGPNPQEK